MRGRICHICDFACKSVELASAMFLELYCVLGVSEVDVADIVVIGDTALLRTEATNLHCASAVDNSS